jgi:hypothetical protein
VQLTFQSGDSCQESFHDDDAESQKPIFELRSKLNDNSQKLAIGNHKHHVVYSAEHSMHAIAKIEQSNGYFI